jgi:hypothetical protein
MTDQPLDPGANWCPDCGLPRGVCDCEERTVEDDYPWFKASFDERCPNCGDELDEAGPLVFCTNLECGWSMKLWEDEE